MAENLKGLTCVAIGERTLDGALEQLRAVADQADVVEIRLDALEKPVIAPFMDVAGCKLLFTNRPVWEGGAWSADEVSRIGLLGEAIEAGADYVDLELLAPDSSHARVRKVIDESKAKLILSNHDFAGTGSRDHLIGTLHRMKDGGADIGKIITTANEYTDVLRVLCLQEEADRIGLDLIAFCMGRAGVISRVATLELNGYMTYCAADNRGGTAPGQLAVSRLDAIRDLLV